MPVMPGEETMAWPGGVLLGIVAARSAASLAMAVVAFAFFLSWGAFVVLFMFFSVPVTALATLAWAGTSGPRPSSGEARASSPMSPPRLRYLLVSAAWLLIGLMAWVAVSNARDSSWVDRFYYAGYHIRVLLAPYLIGGLELFFWFRFFRHEDDGARVFAGLVGIFGFAVVLIMALNWNVTGPWHPLVVVALLYIAAGHLAYSLFGGRRRRTTNTVWIIKG